ncbi:four helix bundle protein [bacterium]|nr:four helix bundle protein [bacterium]
MSVYRLSAKLPKSETYGLQSQIRRAACSIPTNLAEGSGKGSRPEFARYLRIATGSCNELESLLLLSIDLNYLGPNETKVMIQELSEVRRMYFALWKSIIKSWSEDN